MTSASATAPVLRPALQAIVGALTWKRAAVAVLLALLVAALLNPVFSVPFWVLLGRMVFIAALLLSPSPPPAPGTRVGSRAGWRRCSRW